MFCSRCGSEVSGKSRFCPSCGLDLMATTPVAAIVSGQVTDFDMVREALASEYELIEELGRGGMALVYRAKDRQLEREVAVKVLPFSLAFDAEFVERFQREARTSAQLEHPNIIPIYRVGRSGRVIYFVMKYLRGGALSNILGTRRSLTPPEIRRVLLEAGSALGYAAQRGIVHRDIKPDNIMFDEFGQCVLTDFGIAKAATGQKLTGTGMSIGTPHYMSPEQARAQTIDGRSDIYSLGIVAYQCLTGTVPYDGEDSFSIGYKHITEQVPTPQLNSADERRLFEVIRRMLMKDPNDRFQDCEELAQALHGQQTAPAGVFKGRASAIAQAAPGAAGLDPAGLAPAIAPGAVAVASGSPSSPPPFASQPTTPIASPTVDRRKVPIGRRATPRRVADRSLAMRGEGSSHAWIWVVLAIVLGGAGALYYYKFRGFAPAAASTAQADSLKANSMAGDTLSAGLPAHPETTTVSSTTPPAPVPPPPGADSGAAHTPAAAVTPVAPGDSGGIRITGIPARSEVLVDEIPASAAVTRVTPGRHVVAISAPLMNFFVDTVDVKPGETIELTPALTRLGAGTPTGTPGGALPPRAQRRQALANGSFSCEPAVNYDAARCFDERPRPTTTTFVPLPAGAADAPTPSVIWVKVSAEGRTEQARRLRPSNDPLFERAVHQYVRALAWRPARKDGAAIEAWTQWIFPPAPR
jgi:eukaryotic-like serine/threonine-protein kinase